MTVNMNEIRQKNPTINIGMIGSVSNGKSSITEKITGIRTQRHSSETKRNITIKLGYANAKIYKCNKCPPPECYQSHGSETYEANCNHCSEPLVLVKHVSFVDSPGHNQLMAVMLNGTSVMDTSILVESINNNPIPGQQTREHVKAAKIIGLDINLIAINKLDLVKRDDALEKIEEFKKYLTDEGLDKKPIIPVVANYNLNMDVLCEWICKIPEPVRDLTSYVHMIIVRSFNVNHQDVDVTQLEGGVIGGTLTRGILKLKDKIIIFPGLIKKNSNYKDINDPIWEYEPIVSLVESINSEVVSLDFAIPGGLIGVKLTVDPALTAKDNLIGNILTKFENTDTYKVFEILLIEHELINDNKLTKNDIITINCNANNIKAQVVKTKKNITELKLLDKPICCEINNFITLSKSDNMSNNMVIIGRGKIINGFESRKLIY